MEYTTLGRTGLRVSVAGLGCGGFSRLGLGTGKSEADAVAIVRAAIDLGVTMIDTAAAYGTERIVGQAIRGTPRDKLVIATKAVFGRGAQPADPAAVVASLDNSLKELGTDYVDVFQVHGVPPHNYETVRDALVPALLREKAKGKFRHLGVSETAPNDHEHKMVQRAVADGMFDSVMIGFHMLHQNARARVFPLTQQHRVGTLLMFVVRRIFAQADRLAATLRELKLPDLDFLVHPGGASDMTDAAYRFVRYEPGVDVSLFGTGDLAHLRSNIASLLKPPLPATDLDKLRTVYGHLVGIGLDAPPFAPPVR
jgi:aryl-alcohol dehydrogenase-like predicted oxidoreductase